MNELMHPIPDIEKQKITFEDTEEFLNKFQKIPAIAKLLRELEDVEITDNLRLKNIYDKANEIIKKKRNY